jgi:hypothetical protein
LDPGLKWEYQASWSDEPGKTNRLTLTNLPATKLNGRPVIPQKLIDGEEEVLFFVVGDDSGVYVHAVQPPGAAGPQVRSTPPFFLRYPLKPGDSWEGTPEADFLLGPLPLTGLVKTSVESTEEVVNVPAGTFQHCLKTKTTGEVEFEGQPVALQLLRQTWFCPGVGIVKSMAKLQDPLGLGIRLTLTMDLASFSK